MVQLGLRLGAQRNRVGGDNFLDVRFVQTVAGRVREISDASRHANTSVAPALADDLGRLGDGAGGIDHVVDQQRDRVVHFADQLHLGDFAGAPAPLVDNREVRIEPPRVGARAFDAARVGRHHRDFLAVDSLAQVA